MSVTQPDLTAAIRTRLKEDEWQPIETVPKDGSWFDLAAYGRRTYTDVRWAEKLGYFCRDTDAHYGAVRMDKQVSESTHWRRVPSGPHPPALHPKDRGG